MKKSEKLLESKFKNNVKTAIFCDRLFLKNLKFVSVQIDSNGMLYAQDINTLKRIFLCEYQENEYLFYFLGYRPTCHEIENSRYTKNEIESGYRTLKLIQQSFGGTIKSVDN